MPYYIHTFVDKNKIILTTCTISDNIVKLSIVVIQPCKLIGDAVEAHSCIDIVVKFTDEQCTTINQSTNL